MVLKRFISFPKYKSVPVFVKTIFIYFEARELLSWLLKFLVVFYSAVKIHKHLTGSVANLMEYKNKGSVMTTVGFWSS